MAEQLSGTIGPYRIIRLLGEGGIGAVYEASNDSIERRVAIKVLHPTYACQPEFVGRLFNEARAVNRIDHPGLVQVSDTGKLPDGGAYIVMEYLKGDTLARRTVRHGGGLAPADAVRLSAQIADAVAAAHEKGIIHRDLKPENVMIVPDPQMEGGERIKVLDFGLAKVQEVVPGGGVKTKSDAVMGTPLYMSPEQCEGAGQVDAKTDVYALGVILFELISGQLPFVADGPGRLIAMHMFSPPPSLQEKAPKVPKQLADLVMRLLEKSREQRPTMREVEWELKALLRSGSLPTEVVVPLDRLAPRANDAPVPPRPNTTLGQGVGQSQQAMLQVGLLRRSWPLLLAVTALLAVSGSAFYLQMRPVSTVAPPYSPATPPTVLVPGLPVGPVPAPATASITAPPAASPPPAVVVPPGVAEAGPRTPTETKLAKKKPGKMSGKSSSSAPSSAQPTAAATPPGKQPIQNDKPPIEE